MSICIVIKIYNIVGEIYMSYLQNADSGCEIFQNCELSELEPSG